MRVVVGAVAAGVAVGLGAFAVASHAARTASTCGAANRSLETLSDPQRGLVRLVPTATTVAAINRLPRPRPTPTRRRTVFERRVWRVRAQIVEYKLDADQDIHLVLADRGARMIAAMPAPRCLPAATRDRRALISVRRTFETRCGRATGSWRHLGAVASISGVGFWDSPRRQRGHARNNAALHPVTRLRLIAGCKLPSPPPPPPPPTPAADLSVTTSDAPDPVMVGDELRYTATVENRGPDQATGVRLTMALSSGSAEVAMATQGTCAGTTTVTCELGTIASGATATAAIVVHPASAGTLTSTATAAATTRDPNAQNNTAVATTTVTP